MRVFAITKRTGYSNTSARKIPTNTIRNVSPIAQNAASTPTGGDEQHGPHRQQELHAPGRVRMAGGNMVAALGAHVMRGSTSFNPGG